MIQRLLLFPLCSFFLFNTYCQQITQKYLTGKWETAESLDTGGLLSIRFTDSIHLILYSGEEEAGKYTYSIDTLSGLTLLHIEPLNQSDHDADLFLLIRMVDPDTLKVQGSDGTGRKPEKWDTNENTENTGVLSRKKS